MHHRPGYLAADTKVFTPRQRRGAVSDAVENPLDATELGLRASAIPVAGPGSSKGPLDRADRFRHAFFDLSDGI